MTEVKDKIGGRRATTQSHWGHLQVVFRSNWWHGGVSSELC